MARKRTKARRPHPTNVDRVPKTTAVERWIIRRGEPIKRECARINAKMGNYRARPVLLVRTSGDNWKVWDAPTYTTKAAAIDSLRKDTGKKGFIPVYGDVVKEVKLKVASNGTKLWVDSEGQVVYHHDDKIKPTRKAANRVVISNLRKKLKDERRHVNSIEKKIASLQAMG